MKTCLVSGFAVLLAAVLFTGCTGTEKGAGIGAVGGGAVGAIVGHQSGHAAEGALIGAALGGITGAAIGSDQDKRAAQEAAVIEYCPNGHPNDVTGFPPGSQVRCGVCQVVFTVQ